MSSPVLAGLRVLDLTQGSAGPIAGMLLADHGADVVKVEPPGGDPFRSFAASTVWLRGRRSIVLDLHDPADHDRFLALAADADVLIESFAPGVTDRLGIGFAEMRDHNPRLVHCSITGYGRRGPGRDRPGWDALVQARSGLMWEQPGRPDGPVFLRLALPSYGAALLAVAGISAALYAREHTGVGQWVETSLMQGALLWTTQVWKRAEHPTDPLDILWRYRDLVPTPCFEGADGKWFHPMVTAARAALVHLGRAPDEIDLAAMTSGDRDARERNFATARAVFRERPAAEWIDVVRAADIPVQPIAPVESVFHHPQAHINGSVVTADVPGLGAVTQLGHTYRLGNHVDAVAGPPPAADAHRDELLAGGWSDRDPAAPMVATAANAVVGGGSPLRHALEGVRVLDLGTAIAGPFGGMLLADLGADVIKIDPLSPAVGTPGDAVWVAVARGKRSIALDLKSDDGRAILHRLIAGADVLHYNLRPGVAERLGFGADEARAINRRLVFSHLSAYGPDGPLAAYPGTDQMAQALCGLEHDQGAVDAGGDPIWLRFGMTDAASGMLSVIGVLQALRERERTGEGQTVETNILDAGILFASDAYLVDGEPGPRPALDRAQTGIGPYHRIYETAAGWLCVVALLDAQQRALHEVVGVAPADPDALVAAFATRPASDWFERLDAAAVPCEVVARHTDDWCDQPDALANGWVVAYEHPVWGRLEQPGGFVQLSDTPARVAGGPPIVGEHTAEVLGELGFSASEITDLSRAGAVAGAE
jgi:crotonobetainyl-CoA:carnitine CoA-transferase CaiB-like acyl-CoA transferase